MNGRWRICRDAVFANAAEALETERIRATDCDRAAATPQILLGVEPRPVQERLPLGLDDR